MSYNCCSSAMCDEMLVAEKIVREIILAIWLIFSGSILVYVLNFFIRANRQRDLENREIPVANRQHILPPSKYIAQQLCLAAFSREQDCPISYDSLSSLPYVYVNRCGHIVGPHGSEITFCPMCRENWCATQIHMKP